MHAFMIIAHNQFKLLEKLIQVLDDERNTLFIHIDAKVKSFDFDRYKCLAKRSKVIFTEKRIDVTWGDSSQVECEMTLLNTAVSADDPLHPFSYYHLISGVDLPIKSNDDIHRFFHDNNGKEFVHFTSNQVEAHCVNRIRYYHFFRKKRNTFYKILSQFLLRVQKLLHINRLKKNNLAVQKGCNWFSITSSFAQYIVNNLETYRNVFSHSYCADEVFIQTILINSPFKYNLYMSDCNNNHEACMRLIDWERGNPYVWRSEDYDAIMSSPCIFARKFDINADSEIIDMITSQIQNS